MKLQTAIEILEYHQAWRLGEKEDMIHAPKKLTEALNVVLSETKKCSKCKATRVWEMPNSNTFDIKCIGKLIHKYFKPEFESIDPFANKNRIAKITNDLDPEMKADYCMDALDFLKQFTDNSMDFVLYDPPYSPRQVSECYKKLGKTVNMQTTQASFWGNLKKEIARITKPNGIVISFGWNTNGIGKTKGFEIIEILIVAHGGSHNDTICTVERKLPTLF